MREFTGAHGLALFLVLRNLKLRYKQTVLGAAWAVLQPLLTDAVFTVVFGRLARLRRTGCRTPCSPCRAGAVDLLRERPAPSAGNSLVDNMQLITKVYFPRLLSRSRRSWRGWSICVVAFALLLVALARTA